MTATRGQPPAGASSMNRWRAFAAASLALLTACHDPTPPGIRTPSFNAAAAGEDAQGRDDDQALRRLGHIVVIYLENRSFDNLYGEFAGAHGLADAAGAPLQVDGSGAPFATLPQVPGSPFPATLANAPFPIQQYVPANVPTIDLVHRFYQEQVQIDGGRMDKFALGERREGAGHGLLPHGRPAARRRGRPLHAVRQLLPRRVRRVVPESLLARRGADAGVPNAPAAAIVQLAASGALVRDGFVTPDGYAVNTAVSVNAPHPATVPAERLVPNQTFATIGDRLSEKGIAWAWYAGGWSDALAGHPDRLFQFHHQPFAYFANYADGTAAKAEHLKDEQDFLAALQAGKLPAVSFVKPIGTNNEHPGYTDVITGESHVQGLIDAVRASAQWNRTAIIIT